MGYLRKSKRGKGMLNMYDALTKEEIARIEKETEELYGISRLILMENAGRTLAEVIKNNFHPSRSTKILVVCGKGNNGGDGFVAARYLFNMEMDVKVIYTDPPEFFSDLSFTNYKILCKMGIENLLLSDCNKDILKGADIIIDAILGTGIKGKITGKVAELISFINNCKKFVICADIPSGLDADTGIIYGDCVKGNATVSFGFAKKGFYMNKGPEYCGEIIVTDIGFPRFFYKRGRQ